MRRILILAVIGICLAAYFKISSQDPNLSFPGAVKGPTGFSLRPRITWVGKASWYSRHSPGVRKRTANNEIFDDNALTCAIWGVPFNRRLRVTNLETGDSIVCRVNDRGPHRRYVRQGRVIDLTKTAFEQISGLKRGLIAVEIEFL